MGPAGAFFIDTNDQMCGAGAAPYKTEDAGVVLFTDDNHLTRSFSRTLGLVLG